MIAEVSRLLDDACHAGDPPAAACVAIQAGVVVHRSAHGADPEGAPTTAESVFDVASVTKVLATTTAVARLVAAGEVALDAAVSRYLPAFRHEGVSVRALLAHRSGLPAWRPFFVDAMADPIARRAFPGPGSPASFDAGRRIVLDGVLAAPLEVPARRVYSDLGFLALGALVEEVAGESLDAFCDAHLDAGGPRELGFVDLREGASWLDDRHVLPTGTTRPREPAPGQERLYSVPEQPRRPDRGRVDDDNAYAMGGVAGHAGVFGTARGVARFGERIVEELEGATALGIGPDALRAFTALDAGALGPPRALGFDVPTGPASTAGGLGEGPRGAIGHLGFTGCSLWIDLDRRLSVALLTNRTALGRHRVEGIRALRPAVHAALRRALG